MRVDYAAMLRFATHRAAGFALLGLTAVLLAVLFETMVGFGLGPLRSFLLDYVYNGLMIGAGVACAARALVPGRERGAWLMVGLGLASWGIGNVLFVFVYDNEPPFPSIADAFFLAVYPPFYAALVLLLRSRVAEFQRSLWLDGIIGALVTGGIGTAIVFDAVLGATQGSPAAVATNLAYPLGDLLLLALVVWSLSLTGWQPGRSWSLIAAGLVVFGVSDSVFLYEVARGTYHQGTPVDLGWITAAVVLAWAAWQPLQRRRPVSRVDRTRFVVAPLAFGLVGVALTVYDHFARVNVIALVLASAGLVAVIARLGLTFAENMRMLRSSRREARTDALTGLANRRSLLDDLDARLAEGEPFVLAIFDLDGFKHYNDTFGHPAGDGLLVRLARNLDRFVAGRGCAYRMGGDEFCVIVDANDAGEGFEVAAAAADALAERGDGFSITSSFGAVAVPAETLRAADALRLADQRMYTQKHGGRLSAVEQSSSVLLQAFVERDRELGEHLLDVANLAEAVARQFGLRPDEVCDVRIAAALHDAGKMAVPDAILNKPGKLDDAEWEFIRRHTIIGEKILHAAPALANAATLVRSSHERFDGTGYPDRLAGEAIPLGSRIIFVCDAFDAMTSDRPYSTPLSHAEALTELRRCAGTQFDPAVVDAFAAAIVERDDAVAA